MRTLSLLLSSLLALAACLDIQRTEGSPSGGGGSSSSAGAPSAGGVPDFDATPCVQQCVDMSPTGTRNFAAVAACTESARVEECAEACGEAGSTLEPGSASCAVPGSVDPVAACNVCIKRTCCDQLAGCFGDVACITIGICASGCD